MPSSQTLFFVVVLLLALTARANTFVYYSPGDLIPLSGRKGSNTGIVDNEVHVPDMRFPVESPPAYANSQVYNLGGSEYKGEKAIWTDPRNYRYPWRDNFCEERGRPSTLCANGKGHQGQDIRPADHKNSFYWVVAAEDGVVFRILSGDLGLRSDDGTTEYDYLHMTDIQVIEGPVKKGQRLGKVSNVYEVPTTVHLHFSIKQKYWDAKNNHYYSNARKIYISPYMSLVRAYEALIEATGTMISDPGTPPVSCISNTSRCRSGTLYTCNSMGTDETPARCPSGVCADDKNCKSDAPDPCGVPPTVSWTPRASVPMSGILSPASAVLNSTLHMFTWKDEHLVFDTARNNWEQKNNISINFSFGSAATVGNVLYGFGWADAFNGTFDYDDLGDKWSTLTANPFPRQRPATAVIAGKVYLISGVDDQYKTKVNAYAPATNSWSTLADIPVGQIDPKAVAYGNNIYVFSGNTDPTIVQRYNSVSNMWVALANAPLWRTQASVVLLSSTAWLLGGMDSLGKEADSIYLYRIDTNTWCSTTAKLPEAMSNFFTFQASDKIYLVNRRGNVWEGTVH